jgi:hypothetical protein
VVSICCALSLRANHGRVPNRSSDGASKACRGASDAACGFGRGRESGAAGTVRGRARIAFGAATEVRLEGVGVGVAAGVHAGGGGISMGAAVACNSVTPSRWLADASTPTTCACTQKSAAAATEPRHNNDRSIGFVEMPPGRAATRRLRAAVGIVRMASTVWFTISCLSEQGPGHGGDSSLADGPGNRRRAREVKGDRTSTRFLSDLEKSVC